MDGRSRCPNCRSQIALYNNIPVFSYLFLAGKCHNCKKKIPTRDFLIEIATAILFPVAFLLLPKVQLNVVWLGRLAPLVSLLIFLIILSVSIAIFVIDLEHQYIPDSLVFGLWALIAGLIIAVGEEKLFGYLAAGFGSGVFLLLLHLLTLGRGMGLGDVKLALVLGTILGFPLSVVWMFGSFILGSAVGLTLILAGRARFKQKVAFGPFLVLAFFLAMTFGFDLLGLVI